jgi:DNA-binding NarL/FixJ family response regulator
MERLGKRVSVMLVDDHSLFREGVRDLLRERDFDIVGEAASAAEAIEVAAKRKPDVALMDIRMPGGSGIEATRRLANASPDTRVVMITASHDESDFLESVRAGARGFVAKDASIEEIAAAVRAAADGGSVLSTGVTADLLDRIRRASPEPGSEQARLSAREAEVLRLITEGRSNGEIAAALEISEQTVKTYVSALLEKLGVENRIQAAVYAVRHGLI